MPLTLTEKLDTREWNTGDNASVEMVCLLAGTSEDRIANATERTARGVDGLRQDVRNNKSAFVR